MRGCPHLPWCFGLWSSGTGRAAGGIPAGAPDPILHLRRLPEITPDPDLVPALSEEAAQAAPLEEDVPVILSEEDVPVAPLAADVLGVPSVEGVPADPLAVDVPGVLLVEAAREAPLVEAVGALAEEENSTLFLSERFVSIRGALICING